MKTLFSCLSVVACLYSGVTLRAQTVIGQPKFDYNSKSPAVQQMQRAIDIPVSYFTGSANITVPVYTATAKGISLPIAISYQSGGIKADDRSGLVGLGWNLNAGGVITRNVQGNPDEGLWRMTKPTVHKTYYPVGSPPYTVLLWANRTDSLLFVRNKQGGRYTDGVAPWGADVNTLLGTHNQKVRDGDYQTDDSDIFNGIIDSEPDMFYFNFGNYSGKFVFDNNNKPLLIPYTDDIRITPTLSYRNDTTIRTVPGSVIPDTSIYRMNYFSSFVISTPDGKDYYFGTDDNSRIRNNPPESQFWIYNGWALNKIVDHTTNDSITIVYGMPKMEPGGYATIQKAVKAGETCIDLTVLSNTQGNGIPCPRFITSSKEQLEFFYDGKLDSIQLKNRYTNEIIHKYQFDYTYFLSGRFKLKSFITRDLKANEFYPYTFEYYDTPGYAGITAKDYWGYHNGVGNGTSLIPTYLTCTGADRKAHWPAMKLDALIGMSSPTGSKTTIEYEPHDAYAGRNVTDQIGESDAYMPGIFTNFSITDTVGGLRVKSVTTYDPATKDTLYKRFYYKRPGSSISSGFLHTPPSPVADISSFVCYTGNTTNKPKYYISNDNLYQGNATLSHVTYRYVTVKEEKNGVANGSTQYEYHDEMNTDSAFYSNATSATVNEPLASPYDLPAPWQYKRLPHNYLAGKEKEIKIFDAAGVLQKKDTFTYKARYYTDFSAGATFTAVNQGDVCLPYGSSLMAPPPSELSAPMALSTVYVILIIFEEIEEDHFGDEASAQAQEFFQSLKLNDTYRPAPPVTPPPQAFYFFRRYNIRKTAVMPYRTISTYYATPTSTSTDTVTYFYDNTAHLNATATETRNSKNELVRNETYFAFDYNDVNSGDSALYFMKKAFFNPPVASFSFNSGKVTAGGYRTYKIRNRIDSVSILPSQEYLMYVDPAGITPATLNLTGTYPKSLNHPAANFQRAAIYQYNTDNTLSHATKKADEKITLLWDHNGQYAIAQATNADSTDIAYTSFETTYDGRWTVAGAARSTASAMTGARSYALSNGNITKSGLNNTKNYIVSYWSTTTAATISGTTAVAGPLKNGWQYYEHTVTTPTSITISGSVTIDELRLFPAKAQMSTYTFNPFFGVTATSAPSGLIEYYEYDNMGRLTVVRDNDKKIKKVAEYYQTVALSDTAVWRVANAASRMEPCPSNAAYTTKWLQIQQVDMNPNSTTYRTLRWINHKLLAYDNSSWQNTATAIRCKVVGGQNTGEQEREQKDMNPCSPTYNQTRWTVTGTNTTACPLPCTGEDKKVVAGVCETGIKIYTASVYSSGLGLWVCQYHYEWSDCSSSGNYSENKAAQCVLGTPCTPP